MNDDLITVIIPIYNGERYIDNCIACLEAQTYKNFEVFFINDGSTDDSLKILKERCLNRNNYFLIDIKNSGAGFARNHGINHARGKYVCFIDIDDSASPHYLEKLHSLVTTMSADVACAKYAKNKDEDFEVLSDETRILSGQQAVDELLSMTIDNGPMVKMFSREIIGETRMPKYVVAEDLYFNYKIFKKSNRVIVNNSILYSYSIGTTSLSTKKFSAERMDSLEAVNAINDAERSFFSNLRLFMEAYFVIEKIITAKGENDFPQEYRAAKETLTLYRQTVLNDSRTPARAKLIARLLMFGPKFTVKAMTSKQALKRLSLNGVIKTDK